MIDHHIINHLKALRLSGMIDTLEVRLSQAKKDELSHLAFLSLVVQDEIEHRNARRLEARLKKACFEEHKTIEEFDFNFNPRIKKSIITELATCMFMENKEHILIYGPTGVGKSHIAQAIGHNAARRGYSVLFAKAVKMFRNLLASRADNSWERYIKKYISCDLLIIDDFGLSSLTQYQAEDFYEIVIERHLKSSIIITSNRTPGEWIGLLPDQVMANSIMDRLSHHAHHIIIDGGDSYRKRLRPKLSLYKETGGKSGE